MLQAMCECGRAVTEEELVPHCDRCGKPIKEEMLGDAVQFMISPGEDDPDGEGPQFLTILSGDINGETDRSHYCKTCTTFLLDQSFIRDMRELGEEEATPDGEGEDKTPGEELEVTGEDGDE